MDERITNDSTLRAFSVSELSFSLKRTLEETFSHVRVKGEISGCKLHTSGHIYFSLKDEQAVLDAVCWKGVSETLPLKPQEGLEVICTGKITTYPGRSKYQLLVTALEVAGQGALLTLLEERKKKLAAQGLFDPRRKKPLPFFPQRIGVITSPTGAVIRDILHRLADRLPTSVLLWPVTVQGPKAAQEVAQAIAGLNALEACHRPDVIIVARGGGSVEDLWAFNEEEIIFAVSKSQIPIISAVGHETDITLIDYVADRRAPTPTAAAEMAVPVKENLQITLANYGTRLQQNLYRRVQEGGLRLENMGKRLPPLPKIICEYEQRLDDGTERLKTLLRYSFEKQTLHLQSLERLLESYSHHNVLKRGFSLVRTDEGTLVTQTSQTFPGLRVQIYFQDGHRAALLGGQSSLVKKKKDSKATFSSEAQKSFWEI